MGAEYHTSVPSRVSKQNRTRLYTPTTHSYAKDVLSAKPGSQVPPKHLRKDVAVKKRAQHSPGCVAAFGGGGVSAPTVWGGGGGGGWIAVSGSAAAAAAV